MTALIPQGTPQWVAGGAGSATPLWPTGYTPTAGDRAYIYACTTQAGAPPAATPPWIAAPATAKPPPNFQAVYIKDLVGGDTLPIITWVGVGSIKVTCEVTRGDHAPIASCVENGASRGSTQTQQIPFPAVTVSNPNDCLMAFGVRPKTSAADGETVNNLTGFTPLAPASVPSGSGLVASANIWQQTTPTNVALGAQTTTKPDSSQVCQGWIIVFKTLAAASAGFTAQPTVTGITAIPNGAYTVGFTPNAPGTFYAVAVMAGAAAPTATQIKAGQDSVGNAALAFVSKAVTGADTVTLGGLLGNPLYDIYCVLHTTVDSAVVALPGQFLQPTAGFEFAVVTGAPAPGTFSILNGAVPAAVAGDVIECTALVAPDNLPLAMSGTGVPEYSGSETPESFQSRVFQQSSGIWSDLVTDFVNHSPPIFLGNLGPFFFTLNAIVAPLSLNGAFQDPNGGSLQITALSGMPPGIAVSNNALVGAGTVQGVYTPVFQAQNASGDTVTGSLTIVVGNVKVPEDLVGEKIEDGTVELSNVFLVTNPVSIPAPGEPGLIIGTTPAPGDDAVPGSVVIVSVSAEIPSPPGDPNPPVTPPIPPIQDPGTIVSRSPGLQMVISDLFQYWSEDLSQSNSEDLLTVSGIVAGQMRVLRRLLTNPGDYVFNPTYGAGLPAFVGTTTDVAKITALIKSQMLLESVVAQTPAPVITVGPGPTATDPSAIAVSILYTDAHSGLPAGVTFSLTK